MASGNQIIEDDCRSIMSEASQIVYQMKKGDITEVKSFHNPPQAIKDVLMAILILTGCPKSEQVCNFYVSIKFIRGLLLFSIQRLEIYSFRKCAICFMRPNMARILTATAKASNRNINCSR